MAVNNCRCLSSHLYSNFCLRQNTDIFRISQTLMCISARYLLVVENSYQVLSFNFLLLKEE